MKTVRVRFALIDCGRVSRCTRGLTFGLFSEAGQYPYIHWH